MILEIKIPSPGESISEVEIANWMVENGDFVEKDDEIAEIESDKASLPLLAEDSGEIEILVDAGETVNVGDVVAKLDTEAKGEKKETTTEQKNQAPEKNKQEKEEKNKEKQQEAKQSREKTIEGNKNVKISPLARKKMDEYQLSIDDVINGLKRISTKEVEKVANLPEDETEKQKAKKEKIAGITSNEKTRETSEKKVSSLRRKLSRRLVAVKNETAMLTTFNEVDMSAVMGLRKKYQKAFIDKYGIKAGFMGFFIKASALALQEFPAINSMLDGDKIIQHHYTDIGIAVQSPKGLMVPVIRNCESLSLAKIEQKIKEYASLARKNRISIDDMSGGTFTITNGGTFGSLLSTPIINPPQSGILGMHNIQDRPVANEGKVVIRPMMYIALSYDHRLIDGKTSVSFLVKIKQFIENPHQMLFGNQHPDELLLGL